MEGLQLHKQVFESQDPEKIIDLKSEPLKNHCVYTQQEEIAVLQRQVAGCHFAFMSRMCVRVRVCLRTNEETRLIQQTLPLLIWCVLDGRPAESLRFLQHHTFGFFIALDQLRSEFELDDVSKQALVTARTKMREEHDGAMINSKLFANDPLSAPRNLAMIENMYGVCRLKWTLAPKVRPYAEFITGYQFLHNGITSLPFKVISFSALSTSCIVGGAFCGHES
jgi:hypothetical protein